MLARVAECGRGGARRTDTLPSGSHEYAPATLPVERLTRRVDPIHSWWRYEIARLTAFGPSGTPSDGPRGHLRHILVRATLPAGRRWVALAQSQDRFGGTIESA